MFAQFPPTNACWLLRAGGSRGANNSGIFCLLALVVDVAFPLFLLIF